MYFLIFISFLLILVIPSIDAGFNEDVLKLHNLYRKRHGSPALKLDEDLSKDAEAFAKVLAEKDLLELDTNMTDVGENLCWTTGRPLNCVSQWYDEFKDYNFSKPGWSAETGHFTKIVWKATTLLGVGSTKNYTNHKVFVVARYKPQGNVGGKFEDNVLPRKSGSSRILNEFTIGVIFLFSGLLNKFWPSLIWIY